MVNENTIEITIPVLNEEKTLKKQISKLQNHLSSLNLFSFEWKIIITDNGSTDNT